MYAAPASVRGAGRTQYFKKTAAKNWEEFSIEQTEHDIKITEGPLCCIPINGLGVVAFAASLSTAQVVL